MANWQYVFTYDNLPNNPKKTFDPFTTAVALCPGKHGGPTVCIHETFLQDLDELPEVKSLIKVKTVAITPPIIIEIDGEELFKFDPVSNAWFYRSSRGTKEWFSINGDSLNLLLNEVVKIVS